jgi:hypothetical protein
MRKIYSFLLVITIASVCFGQDLPNPGSNLQTLPSGSYIIAMDNTNQANTAGNFNLKSYGLIVHLLNNNVRMRWVITAGKIKDAVDITVNAQKVKPATATSANLSFRAGPFVIFAQDLANVNTLIDGYYTANSLTGNNRPSVYMTNAAATVDVRYDMIGFKPKAAVLNDGANQAIHLANFTACSIPTISYAVSNGTDLVTQCFTFASEPHNDNSGTAVDVAINGINTFVKVGGNFLAQCEGVITYENRLVAINAADGNPLTNGGFQTLTGITDANSNAGTAIKYPNPDLSFNQYQGNYSISKGGSLKNWKVATTRINNTHSHSHVTADTTIIGSSVSKVRSGTGGLVFYIGNHRFDDDLTTLSSINGLRMYMNAFLTPVSINSICATGGPLPVTLTGFAANRNRNQVELQWSTSIEANSLGFEIQRKNGDFDYISVGFVQSKAINGFSSEILNYHFTDLNATKGTSLYRLRQVDKDGRAKFSDIRSVRGLDQTSSVLVFPNPSYDGKVNISFNGTNDKRNIILTDAAGRTIKQWNNSSENSVQAENLVSGMYQIRIVNQVTGIITTDKIIVSKH